MKEKHESDTPLSRRKWAEREPAIEHQDMTARSGLSGSSTTKGASRKRGPRGFLSLLEHLKKKPALWVWAPVVSKLACIGALLSLVAYLGHRSRAEEIYGSFLKSDSSLGVMAVSKEPAKNPLQVFDSDPYGIAHASSGGQRGSERRATASSSPCQKQEEESPSGLTEDGRVILNEANSGEMTRLPAVGPARADAILKLRKRLGGFKKISDLLRVRGIGWKTLRKMKEKIILNRPEVKGSEEPAPEGMRDTDSGAKHLSPVSVGSGGAKKEAPS